MNSDNFLHISTTFQQLDFVINSKITKSYPVSTAKNGLGEIKGSECTPCGWHRIRAKIGGSQPLNSVFVARRPTGEIYTTELAKKFPNRDWILTRILWLDGLEIGKNRYGNVHTASRYIYIHGSPDNLIRCQPESHGCIRMKNDDIADLFERVTAGMKVYIG
ncbi:MAG: L,D-transpeptidase [Methylococcales bacterium]|nr:L,D-transpeptidase [Methylococcales bacterium]